MCCRPSRTLSIRKLSSRRHVWSVSTTRNTRWVHCPCKCPASMWAVARTAALKAGGGSMYNLCKGPCNEKSMAGKSRRVSLGLLFKFDVGLVVVSTR